MEPVELGTVKSSLGEHVLSCCVHLTKCNCKLLPMQRKPAMLHEKGQMCLDTAITLNKIMIERRSVLNRSRYAHELGGKHTTTLPKSGRIGGSHRWMAAGKHRSFDAVQTYVQVNLLACRHNINTPPVLFRASSSYRLLVQLAVQV